MKNLMVTLVLSLSFSSAFGAGLFHDSKPVNSPTRGNALVDALLNAEDTSEVDLCYKGNYEEALGSTKKATKGEIGINLIDVYGEDKYPTIDVEFTSRDGGSSASAQVSACR